MQTCEDFPCCGHVDGLGCNWTPESVYNDPHLLCDHEVGVCEVADNTDYYCCDSAWQEGTSDIPGRFHDETCENFDGAPGEQWEVTDPFQYTELDDRGEHDPSL